MAAAIALLAALGVAALPDGTTYAAWSDFATVPVTVGAGVWLTDGDPPLPDQCLGIVFDRIVVGTNQNDVLNGTAGNDLIFGQQGKDVLSGLGGQDCLVGGTGKDQLLGGDGDDVLVGGNAKDKLTGGTDGSNDCDGGRGKNTLIQCEQQPGSPPALLVQEPESVVVIEQAGAEPVDQAAPAVAPLADGGASVEEPPEAPLVELEAAAAEPGSLPEPLQGAQP